MCSCSLLILITLTQNGGLFVNVMSFQNKENCDGRKSLLQRRRGYECLERDQWRRKCSVRSCLQSLLPVKRINFILRRTNQPFNMQKNENNASSLLVKGANGRSNTPTRPQPTSSLSVQQLHQPSTVPYIKRSVALWPLKHFHIHKK
jgi:hypothetical protein